ncbi:MAG: hypothetical protein CL943_03715 [Candidatus Diapherotrites archaeon]|uniref:Methyltransferase small domain-containing protein n=1 Tax=Candidatus Iainarchaeum sp. TaxID=3101447 RepID=A0A2D6M1U4_9ARCH|nr:hypothetical protein [Candidatus Diapherotrites archaeon]|tara:strand:+ start:1801 stop:2385 length:585 start_codon:yes stop_codon:yes gene_type:complete
MKQANLSNVSTSGFPSVYAPREDSFLLEETVEVKANDFVLDLGCGSGIQGISAALKGAKKVLSVDINKEALECTAKNAKLLGVGERIETRESNLFENIKEQFDCIIFNPPYVPSKEKKWKDTDGGKQGREVLDLFLEQFPEHLREQGTCFFLQSSLNSEAESSKKLCFFDLSFSVIARRKLFFEEIMVFKCFNQ